MKKIAKVLAVSLAGLLSVSFLGCGNPASGGFSSDPLFDEVAKECTEDATDISSADLSGKWEFVQEGIMTMGGISSKRFFKATLEIESGNKFYYAAGSTSELTEINSISAPTEYIKELNSEYGDKINWASDKKSYKVTETFTEKTECDKASIKLNWEFSMYPYATRTKNSAGTQYLEIANHSEGGESMTMKTILTKKTE